MEYQQYDDQSQQQSPSYYTDDQESSSETQGYARPMSSMPGEMQEYLGEDYESESEQQ